MRLPLHPALLALFAACASSKPTPTRSTVVQVPDASASASEPAAEEAGGPLERGFVFDGDGGWDYHGSIGSSANQAQGTLDRSEIRRVVNSWAPKLTQCYEPELAQDPMLVVKTAPRFVIGPDGKVVSADISPSTGIARLDKCLIQTFLQMQFPPPSGGGNVTVSYPLHFRPSS